MGLDWRRNSLVVCVELKGVGERKRERGPEYGARENYLQFFLGFFVSLLTPTIPHVPLDSELCFACLLPYLCLVFDVP